jgi:hypothetical protein
MSEVLNNMPEELNMPVVEVVVPEGLPEVVPEEVVWAEVVPEEVEVVQDMNDVHTPPPSPTPQEPPGAPVKKRKLRNLSDDDIKN